MVTLPPCPPRAVKMPQKRSAGLGAAAQVQARPNPSQVGPTMCVSPAGFGVPPKFRSPGPGETKPRSPRPQLALLCRARCARHGPCRTAPGCVSSSDPKWMLLFLFILFHTINLLKMENINDKFKIFHNGISQETLFFYVCT